VPGDFNGDQQLAVADLQLVADAVRTQNVFETLDLTGDGNVDLDDHAYWVHEIKGTTFGDANLDRQFDSSDLVQVFQAGQYEDTLDGNSGWATGDWNADGDFTSADLIVAFQDGGYEQSLRAVATAVPEPAGSLLLLLSAAAVVFRGYKRG
jgi:hypothetical protein